MKKKEHKTYHSSPLVDCCFILLFGAGQNGGFQWVLTLMGRDRDTVKDSASCRVVWGGDLTLGMSPLIILITKVSLAQAMM